MKMNGMKQYVLEGLFTLILVTFLSFLLMRISPVDPAEAYARRNTVQPSSEKIEEIREKMGLNDPLIIQYSTWVLKAITFDFGNSLTNNQPVKNDLVFAVGCTLKISAISIVLQIILTLIIGFIDYYVSQRKSQLLLNLITIILISIPPFYIASLYIDVFSLKLNLIKVINSSGLMRYLSPAICIALPSSVFHGRLLGKIFNKIRKREFVNFLQCRGLSDTKILFNHILPHGLILIIPTFMQNIGMIIASSGVIEKMFNIPGVGYMLIEHVIARDAPMIHAIILFFSIVLIITNILGKILQNSLIRGAVNEG